MAAPQRRPINIDCNLVCNKFLKSVLSMKLQNLKEIEDHISTSDCPHPLDLKDFIFDGYTASGTTPLILASQYGELDSVKHLVESWGVDVRTSAKYYSDPTQPGSCMIQINKATPLFVAAFYGHNLIVRYLLEKGADVSVRTSKANAFPEYDGLTPLYGAVSKRHSYSRPLLEQQEVRHSVVLSLLEFGANLITDPFRLSDGQPMWMERMCGVNTTTTLVNHGLNVKQSDPNSGLTILHHILYFIKEDSLALVKLLIDKGADLTAQGNPGFTPLLSAANFHYPNWTVLDYLLDRDEYGQMEKIETMELAGAHILLNIPCPTKSQFPKAFQYWRRAHHLRQIEKERSSSSSEKILGRKIGRNVEWTTLDEIEQLEQHPEDYRIQALMVELRIISSRCQQEARFISHRYLLKYFSHSTSLDNEENITQIIDMRWGMFDQIIRSLDHISINVLLWNVIKENVCALVKILSALQIKSSTHFNFETIKTSLDLFLQSLNPSPFMVTFVEHHSAHVGHTRIFGAHFSENLFSLIKMIFSLDPEALNVHNRASLAQSLRQLGHDQLGNLLLRSCKSLKRFNSIALVRIFLDVGAHPDFAIDIDHGNTSLHFVAGMSDRQLGNAVGRLLVEFGAKLHKVNNAGKTALDVWIELSETEDDLVEEAVKWSTRPEWCQPVQTLLCLAARVIRVHKIPYADGATPTNLYPLIELRNLR